MYKQICPKIIPLEFKCAGVYCISFELHFYIGSSKNIQARISQHRKNLRACKHWSLFQKYYNIFGEDKMCINLLEKCDVDKIKERKKYWIEILEPDINCNKIHNTSPQTLIFNGVWSKKSVSI